MLFGINGGEFIVLLIVAAVVIGPERLPGYAEQLAGFVRSARKMLSEAKTKVDSEFGAELGDVDWASLDPRRYDPRRIVRDALMEDEGLGLGAIIGSQNLNTSQTGPATASGPQQTSSVGTQSEPRSGFPKQAAQLPAAGESAPFDDEAT